MTADQSRAMRVREKLLLSDEQGGFAEFGERLRKRIDPGMYASWLAGNSGTEVVGLSAGSITIAARSPWFAKQIRLRFERQILEAAGVPSLRIVVRAEGGTQ
jgi:hypothetical protein